MGVIARLTRTSGRLSVIRRQGSDDLGEPLDRTWCAAPGRPALRDVLGRLVGTTHGDVVAVYSC